MEPGKKTYRGIDCFKLAAALFVVGIHTSFLWDINPTVSLVATQVVARVAVPFFFICTGFFYAKSMPKAPDAALGYLARFNRKLLSLYAAWVALMLPFWAKRAIDAYGLSGKLILPLARTTLFDPGVLWYILALCVCSLAAYRSVRARRLGGLFAASCVFYLFGLFGDSYYGLVRDLPVVGDVYRAYFAVFAHVRKGLPFGLLFFVLGARFALREERISPNPVVMTGLLILSLCLRYGEFAVLRARGFALDNSVSLFGIPPAIFAFLLALGTRPPVSDETSLKLRSMSSAIYFSHQWILEILGLTVFRWGWGITDTGRWLLAVGCCLLLAAGIQKSGVRFLKRLINS